MCFFLTLVSLSSCRKDANFVNFHQTLAEEMGMRSTLNIDDVVVHEESSQTVVGRKEERSKGKHDCDTEPMSPPRKKGHSSTKDVGAPSVVECFVEDVSASPHKTVFDKGVSSAILIPSSSPTFSQMNSQFLDVFCTRKSVPGYC
jgi:hypothetical protein